MKPSDPEQGEVVRLDLWPIGYFYRVISKAEY